MTNNTLKSLKTSGNIRGIMIENPNRKPGKNSTNGKGVKDEKFIITKEQIIISNNDTAFLIVTFLHLINNHLNTTNSFFTQN